LNNELFAQTFNTDSLTLGAIDKKHFTISGTTTTGPGVPEPASLSGLLIGAAGLVMRRRRLM
jgi:hypothetical protein